MTQKLFKALNLSLALFLTTAISAEESKPVEKPQAPKGIILVTDKEGKEEAYKIEASDKVTKEDIKKAVAAGGESFEKLVKPLLNENNKVDFEVSNNTPDINEEAPTSSSVGEFETEQPLQSSGDINEEAPTSAWVFFPGHCSFSFYGSYYYYYPFVSYYIPFSYGYYPWSWGYRYRFYW